MRVIDETNNLWTTNWLYHCRVHCEGGGSMRPQMSYLAVCAKTFKRAISCVLFFPFNWGWYVIVSGSTMLFVIGRPTIRRSKEQRTFGSPQRSHDCTWEAAGVLKMHPLESWISVTVITLLNEIGVLREDITASTLCVCNLASIAYGRRNILTNKVR